MKDGEVDIDSIEAVFIPEGAEEMSPGHRGALQGITQYNKIEKNQD